MRYSKYIAKFVIQSLTTKFKYNTMRILLVQKKISIQHKILRAGVEKVNIHMIL